MPPIKQFISPFLPRVLSIENLDPFRRGAAILAREGLEHDAFEIVGAEGFVEFLAASEEEF
jgi:hypothetical protein